MENNRHAVLARKYRPTTFDEVVGQEMICRTIKKSFEVGRIPQAWLLAGPSGVGKTTCARIIARMLNCLSDQQPVVTPCGTCSFCQSIAIGESLDFLEIDGASNNGVDEIRQLREHVGFLPQQSRYRIILIDEVHMLSVSAFNALLKTLEEPPEHVKFIFATTEPEKILPTVRARTQRYDFSPVSDEAIHQHLEFVSAQEQVDLEKGTAEKLAQLSGGSVRHALMLLDQLGSDGAVTLEKIKEFSGKVLPVHIEKLSALTLAYQAAEAIQLLDELMKEHQDPLALVDQWSHYLRLMIEQKVIPLDHGVTIPEGISLESLLNHSQYLFDIRKDLQEITDVAARRTFLTLVVTKLCQKRVSNALPDLLKRLEGLERKIGTSELPVEQKLPVEESELSSWEAPPSSEQPRLCLDDLIAHLEKDRKISLVTGLKEAELNVVGQQVTFRVDVPFHYEIIKENEGDLIEVLKKLMGHLPILKIIFNDPVIRQEEESLSESDVSPTPPSEGVNLKIQKLKKMLESETE